MRVSAIKSYDYVHKNNNGPQQPCPAPMPYATKPNFGASATQAVTGLKKLGQKVLGFVAAMGLFTGVAVQKAYGQQQVDSPFKIYMSVKGSDGKEELKPMGIADDADYMFDFNGKTYTVTVDDLLGFGIYDEEFNTLYTLPMDKEQQKIMLHLAAVDGKPNELSPEDIQLVNTKNLRLPNYRVTRIKKDDMQPNETEVLIEHVTGGKTISYFDAYTIWQPTAHFKE